METGERIIDLRRTNNARLGISRKEDTLRPRFLVHKRGGGPLRSPRFT